jgi:hypothetical protein
MSLSKSDIWKWQLCFCNSLLALSFNSEFMIVMAVQGLLKASWAATSRSLRFEQLFKGGRIGVRVNGGSRIAGLALIFLFGLSVFAVAESGGNRIFVYKQGNSDAIIEQARDGNYSYISQEGNANNAIANISGGSNGTTQTQSGNDNQAYATLVGIGNAIIQIQTGDNSHASAVISGTRSSIGQYQIGDHNRSAANISGNNSMIQHFQIGDSLEGHSSLTGNDLSLTKIQIRLWGY